MAFVLGGLGRSDLSATAKYAKRQKNRKGKGKGEEKRPTKAGPAI